MPTPCLIQFAHCHTSQQFITHCHRTFAHHPGVGQRGATFFVVRQCLSEVEQQHRPSTTTAPEEPKTDDVRPYKGKPKYETPQYRMRIDWLVNCCCGFALWVKIARS